MRRRSGAPGALTSWREVCSRKRTECFEAALMTAQEKRKVGGLLCVVLCAVLCTACAAAVNAHAGEEPVAAARQIRIAAIGFVPRKWDKEANFQKLVGLIEEAAKAKPDLIVTPEGILEGYVIDSVREADEENPGSADEKFLDIAEPLDGKYIVALRELAKRLGVYLIVGFAERVPGNRVYNSAALIGREGEIVGVYHKSRTIHEKWRPDFYLRGTERPAFKTSFGKIGILICYDRHFQVLSDDLKRNAAEVIFIPAYGTWGEKNDHEMQERARETGLPLLFVHPNQVLLVDASGSILLNRDRRDVTYCHHVTIPLK
jgi:predicted amidohydrolase